MPLSPLPITDIVRVIVNLSKRAATRKAFDMVLLIGENSVIDKAERVRLYTSTDAMLQDGFSTDDRLYKAAQLVMGQYKKPIHFMIGTKGSDESELVAFKECRAANSEWYVGIMCEEMTATKHVEIAKYAQAATPDTIYAFTTAEDADKQKSDDSVFAKLKKLNIRRAIGQYSTKDNNAICAIIGYALGSMTGTVGSAFTLAYKQEVGVETENSDGPFSAQEVQNIIDENGNVYVNRGGQYDGFERGTMADGTWFDEIIYLDKLKNDIMFNIMDLLYSNPKVEALESGMTRIHNKIIEVLEHYIDIGFIANGGRWTGPDVLNLKNGDTLPKGYLVQSELIEEQAQADREARQSPPFYICVKLAGAIQTIVIQVQVNR